MPAEPEQPNQSPPHFDQPFDRERMSRREFFQRLLITIGVILAAVLILALFYYSVEVVLLIFAGILFAIFLRGVGSWISRHTGLSINWALTIVLLSMIGLIVLGGWLLAPSIQKQFEQISQELPQTINQVRETVSQYAIGQWALKQIPENPQQLISKQPSNVFGRITGFFSSFLGGIVDAAIILVTGIYFAFNPDLYYEGVIKLLPKERHRRAREVLDTLGYTLRRWLLGRLAVMPLNGTLAALGLWMLDVPLAIPLGIILSILNFVPNIGPILAAIPAVLIALTQSPQQALYVAILYLVIENLEGMVLTPLIQQKAVSLPPVLVIGVQILFGILFGFMGLLLAVPILAVFFVIVKMLYVEDLLGNKVEVKGEEDAKENNAHAPESKAEY